MDAALINISISNYGDEPAYDIVLVPLPLEGFYSNTMMLSKTIEPNSTKSAELNVTINNVVPGVYLLPIKVLYRDYHKYALSSIYPILLTYKNITKSGVNVFLPKYVDLGDNPASVGLRLENNENVEYSIRVALILPDELKSDFDVRHLTLGSQTQSVINFNLSSYGALAGSRYPILVAADYYYQNVHYTSVASGIVGVNSNASNPKSDMAFFYVITVTMLFAGGLYYLKKRPPNRFLST